MFYFFVLFQFYVIVRALLQRQMFFDVGGRLPPTFINGHVDSPYKSNGKCCVDCGQNPNEIDRDNDEEDSGSAQEDCVKTEGAGVQFESRESETKAKVAGSEAEEDHNSKEVDHGN